MFSHHSHSGDYIAHGVDHLEMIIEEVKRQKFHTYCLTEHMPRISEDLLYPEEITEEVYGAAALKKLEDQFMRYLDHARKIKEREKEVKILVGVEVEGCNEKHISYAIELVRNNADVLKFMVGSVHHVHDICIDFDQEEWILALEKSGNNLKQLLLDYFKTQKNLLERTKPIVVGHFDLIRLFFPNDLKIDPSSGSVSESGEKLGEIDSVFLLWPEVKTAIIDNLRLIESYGGLLEINTSGLRKKLKDPYPDRDIIELAKTYAPTIKFVFSDDAHGVAQVGVCYDQLLKYVEEVVKLESIAYLAEDDEGNLIVKDMKLSEIKEHEFWRAR